jgi:hypothetical protein
MLTQGRLPRPTDRDVEVAVTPETAGLLKSHVGTALSLSWTIYTGPAIHSTTTSNIPQSFDLTFTVHVVGIFHVQSNDPFWHGYNFLPQTPDRGCCTHYTVLASQQNLLAALDRLAKNHNATQVFFLDPSYVFWYYYLAPARINANQLNDFINQLAITQASIAADTYSKAYVALAPPYIQQVNIFSDVIDTGGAPSILKTFRSKLAVAQISAVILELEIVALILLFVGMMALLLVDRQAGTIALLRSRGANRGQVFGAFMIYAITHSLIALLVGPLLAMGAVYFIIERLLPPTAQDAMNVISNDPLQALLGIKWYALGAAVVVIATMAVSLYRATRVDVWSTDNQASQSARRPLWQRLRLDLVAALVALAGYGISVYLSSIEGLVDTQTQTLVVSPLALLAPVLLLLAVVLLFLRFLPVLLQVSSHLVNHGRGAIPVLAVAQMARTPRQPVRTILLPGFVEVDSSAINATSIPVEVQAVDPDTITRATIWTSYNSSQAPTSFLAQLITLRTEVIRTGIIPPIVDASTWNVLHLHAGATFNLYKNATSGPPTRYLALAQIRQFPAIDTDVTTPHG